MDAGGVMPELLVISDTHGDSAVLATIFRWARRRGLSSLAFLGDGLADIGPASADSGFLPEAATVRGNGDSGSGASPAAEAYRVLDFAGRRFFLCHGHTVGVQDSFDALLRIAGQAEAAAALYGHTHVPFWDEIGGTLVLNPGSPSRPRCGAPPTFATIDCPADGSWFVPRHWVVQGTTIRPFDPA